MGFVRHYKVVSSRLNLTKGTHRQVKYTYYHG